jgi:hypothetical protein
MKLAVIITSDPKGGDEALGRAYNALVTASEAQKRDDEVQVAFIGAGTRWPEELQKPTHPAHQLYDSVRPNVGTSAACAALFGAKDAPRPAEISVRGLLADGYQTLVF